MWPDGEYRGQLMKLHAMEIIGTVEWHMNIVKNHALRGKFIESHILNVVIIKVSGTRSRSFLEYYFKHRGVVSVQYRIQKLGWFECWFPRYQIEG